MKRTRACVHGAQSWLSPVPWSLAPSPAVGVCCATPDSGQDSDSSPGFSLTSFSFIQCKEESISASQFTLLQRSSPSSLMMLEGVGKSEHLWLRKELPDAPLIVSIDWATP